MKFGLIGRKRYSAVRAPPHLLQVEFFDTSFVWSDSRAFDPDTVLDNGIGSIDCYLIIGLAFCLRCCCNLCESISYLISVFQSQIKILDIKFEVRQDELCVK